MNCKPPEMERPLAQKARLLLPKWKSGLLSLCVAAVLTGCSVGFISAAASEAAGAETAPAIGAQNSQAAPAAQEEAEHGLPQKAVEIARPFGFPITNSMVVSWIVALCLIVFAQYATRKMTQVSVKDTVRGFKEILEGKHDQVPEGNFYMKGGIEEVTQG